MQDDAQQVLEAEVVGGDASMMVSIGEMINSNLASIQTLEESMKKYAEMLQSMFDNDPTYQEHTKQAKEAVRVKSQTKQQILKMPQAADLNSKVKDLKLQIKETRASLSEYLQEYARLSGSSSFEDSQGVVRKIVYVAKLVKE